MWPWSNDSWILWHTHMAFGLSLSSVRIIAVTDLSSSPVSPGIIKCKTYNIAQDDFERCHVEKSDR